MKVDEILARLERVKPSGDGWTACCAKHDDRHQSLSVNVGRNGETLLHCHAGCATEDVVAAMGLDDGRPVPGQRR